MDKLYGDNAQMKAKLESLEDENKNLEQGLKEVMEAMKKYGAPTGDGMEKGEREEMVMQFPTLERMLAVSMINFKHFSVFFSNKMLVIKVGIKNVCQNSK